MGSKFRWAYIGSGIIADKTAQEILKSGQHEITAVYSRNYANANAFAKKHGAVAYDSIKEAVDREDVDGVYIATVHTAHAQEAIECLKLRKPVLCEKPVTINTVLTEEIIQAAKDNDTYFAEAMWTWFSDVARTVKGWITEGKIGKVIKIEAAYAFATVRTYKASRLLDPQVGGGALLDIGVYPITYCYRLLGIPTQIKCQGTIEDGVDTGEEVELYYGNTVCKLTISLTDSKGGEDMIIYGEKGTIQIPTYPRGQRAILKSAGEETVFEGNTEYITQFSRAAKEIQEGLKQSSYVPFTATIESMKIMDECRRQMGLIYPME